MVLDWFWVSKDISGIPVDLLNGCFLGISTDAAVGLMFMTSLANAILMGITGRFALLSWVYWL